MPKLFEPVSICQAAMGEGTFGTTVIPQGHAGEEFPVQVFRIDSAYLTTYGIELQEGRMLSRTADAATGGLIINNAFLQQMGWAEGVNKTIQFPGSEARIPIVGVVKDFNYSSLHQQVDHLVMYLDDRKANISVRLNIGEVSALLPKMKQLWETFEQRYPFDYYFVEEYFARRYVKEKAMLRTISVFAAVAIFIACLGLYGMIAFSIARREKEIGIRKVLGASIASLFGLLTKNFFFPLLFALLIAIPASWYFLSQWLQNFTYLQNTSSFFLYF